MNTLKVLDTLEWRLASDAGGLATVRMWLGIDNPADSLFTSGSREQGISR